MLRLLSLCLLLSFPSGATLINTVQVIMGPGMTINNVGSAVGSVNIGVGFPQPGFPSQAVTISYNGAAASDYGTLRNRISLSVSTPFTVPSPVGGIFSGVSGASITRWTDSWTITSNAASSANGNLRMGFHVTGSGTGTVTLTVNGVTAVNDGSGFWSVQAPVTLGAPTSVYSEFIVQASVAFPGGSASLDFFNTVVLSSVDYLDGGTTAVPFTLNSGVGASNFVAFSTESNSAVPEPATAGLFGFAVLGCWAGRRLNRRATNGR